MKKINCAILLFCLWLCLLVFTGCGRKLSVDEITAFDGSTAFETNGSADDLASEDLAYTISRDGTYYSVSGIGLCSDLNLVIPASHKSKPVKEISDSAFYECSKLISVSIPNSIIKIGDQAFASCSGLTSIVISDSVASIGEWAFVGCTSLESITVGCENLFFHSSGSCLIETSSKTLLLGCKNSSIPEDGSVTSIGQGAFYGCYGLTSVTIPNSVTYIGSCAFWRCTGLTSVVIGNSVTSIGGSAFNGCTGLTSVTIPDSVTTIGSDTFSGCNSLQYNKYDNAYYLGNESNPYVALIKAKDTSITSCAIHPQTRILNAYAFFGCRSLLSIIIPDSVVFVGDYAFWRCPSLTSVSIGDGTVRIGASAFSMCNELTSVIIGNGVVSIGPYVFSQCPELTSVTFRNASNWYISKTSDEEKGTNVMVTDASTNATNLGTTYYDYYWYRK